VLAAPALVALTLIFKITYPGLIVPTIPANPARATLADLTGAERGRIAALRVSASDRGWLEAIGLGEGEVVTVLRRAPFGGPLHVRTGEGGEFAVDRALAARVDVTSLPTGVAR
jgi:Fe2+ transport system protein FeoA